MRYFRNGRKYYLLDITKNLFGDYCVESLFGNIFFRNHTGRKIKIFKNNTEAIEYANYIIKKRFRRGYKLLT